jgi:hypothetical protein
VDSAVSETVQTQSRGAHEFVDRRLEQRTPCDDISAQVRIGEGLNSTPASVLDISTSGVRLGLDSSLEVGSNVTVWFNKTVVTGQVRYCRGNQDGSFDAGLRLLDVLNLDVLNRN